MVSNRLCWRVVVTATALFAVACSSGSNGTSPSGPSAFVPDTSSGAGGWTASTTSIDTAFGATSPNGHRRVAGAGTVAHLTGTCPTLSMVVNGVRVTTNAGTDFFIGTVDGGCGNLRPGTRVVVEADATPDADGSYIANTVTIVDQPGGKPPQPVEGDGTVGSLKGTCPALTMVVHGYPVMTTSATNFVDGACADIHAGTRVHVEGTLEGNSVLAALVRLLPAQP